MSDLKPLYLTKLHLKGYKSIIDCEFEINKGLNILIGKNGAGKSNLFEFIEGSVTSNPKEKNFKYVKFDLDSFSQKNFSIELERIVSDLGLVKEGIAPRFTINRKLFIDNSLKINSLLDSNHKDFIEIEDEKIHLPLQLDYFFRKLGFVFPSILNLRYALPSKIDGIDKPFTITIEKNDISIDFPETLNFIEEIGYNIHEGWDLSETYNDEEIIDFISENLFINQKIKDNLEQFSPIKNVKFSSNFSVYQDDINIIIDNIKLEFFVNDTWLPWSQLSDGTRRLFYLITEVSEKEDSLILIEEPELGIHPYQFSLLMDFIKKESETKQIIISTHSPKALDHLDKDELDNILIASYEKSKGTQVRHLSNQEKEHAANYREEVGFLSDFWLYSSLEE